MRIVASPTVHKLFITVTCVAVAAWAFLARTPSADACGCFAPPDPSVPIVQTGERIAFAMEDGKVTAHIQIQYSGAADEFAWLVPLPAVPEMTLGTDELFAQLIAQTQPKYRVNREYLGACEFDPSRNGGPLSPSDSAGEDAPDDGSGPLVIDGSIGPFDFAVLRADDKQEMLTWLETERFFVPAGTDTAVDPYIRPGAFFLALKLQKGNDVGDIQPVVLTYESQLPMIPIVLTSVAADPDMGVLVWVLGEHRAIPRNYFHTKINDAAIDWLNFGANYVDVVTRAVDDADGHHSFVTEYAGTSGIMQSILDYQGRFGDLNELRLITDAEQYINYLTWNGYAVASNQGPFGFTFTSQALSILDRHLPMPAALADQGITPNDYYTNISYYLGFFRDENPELFLDLDLDYDPVALTDELEERIVTPTLEAGAMFNDNSYLTRLFTTLSPEEMTKDPVFSFNPDLEDVSNIHDARLIYRCSVWDTDEQATTPAELITEQGWVLPLPDGEANNPWLDVAMPASLFTEILREEGQAEVVGDNSDEIGDAIDDQTDSGFLGGCSVSSGGGLGSGLLLGFALLMLVRRRRR